MLGDERRAVRRLGIVAIVLCAWWAASVLCVAQANLPYNALTLFTGARLDPVRVLMPQGWAFFTKSPRDERLYIYRYAGAGRWVDATMREQARARWTAGLDRARRAQGVEAGLLMEGIMPSAWHQCKDAPLQCLGRDSLAPIAVSNREPSPTLCGDVGFVMQPPVPWAWIASRHSINMPSRVMRVRSKC